MGFFFEKNINISLLEEILGKESQVQNPVLGYYAQYKLREKLKRFGAEHLDAFQDHGDMTAKIGRYKYVIECKLISKYIPKKTATRFIQLQSSNCRDVFTEDGVKHRTSKYLIGTFDIAAACTFPINGKWNFLFCKASELKHDGKGFWKTRQDMGPNWHANIRKTL